MTGSPYDSKPLPSGVPRPMCFCGDPCKVDISKDEETYKQTYWMCSNFVWEPTPQQRHSNFIMRNFIVQYVFYVIWIMIYFFCNNYLCCRLLHHCLILSSGSTLRSRSQTSGFYKAWRSGIQSVRRYWRRDVDSRLYRRNTRKRRKGCVLLRTGRRGRRSLSVCG